MHALERDKEKVHNISSRFASRTALALAITAVVVCGCARTKTPPANATSTTNTAIEGSKAADFVGRDILDGKSVQLSSLLGTHVVLLSFSVTFCEPCVAEFPHLRAMYEAKKTQGFVVVGIAMDGPETIANVPAFIRRNQLKFPVIADENSLIASFYNPKKTAPYSVLIDRTGRIAAVRSGYTAGDEVALAKDVAQALGESSAPALQ